MEINEQQTIRSADTLQNSATAENNRRSKAVTTEQEYDPPGLRPLRVSKISLDGVIRHAVKSPQNKLEKILAKLIKDEATPFPRNSESVARPYIPTVSESDGKISKPATARLFSK